jgi:quercetin dioxygenase-like cupin family protein
MRPPIEAVASGAPRRWDDVPAEQIAEGIERQMIVGAKLMMCRLRFRPGVETAEHSHPHEQMTVVESGRVQFTIAGEARVVRAGDILHFAPGVVHGATILDEEVVLIDIFTPVREDFLPGSMS